MPRRLEARRWSTIRCPRHAATANDRRWPSRRRSAEHTFLHGPCAALAIDVARLRIGLSTAEGETGPLRSLPAAPGFERGTSSCLATAALGGVETSLLFMPATLQSLKMRLNRCGVVAAGGVLDRCEVIEELLDKRLGPLATRDDDDDDDGGVVRYVLMLHELVCRDRGRTASRRWSATWEEAMEARHGRRRASTS